MPRTASLAANCRDEAQPPSMFAPVDTGVVRARLEAIDVGEGCLTCRSARLCSDQRSRNPNRALTGL